MKIMKRKGYEDITVRTVCTDDRKPIAFIGTVGDMLEVNLLSYCDYSLSTWCLLSNTRAIPDQFASTREQLIETLRNAGY